MSDPVQDQPPPAPSSGDVWLEVIADMHTRRALGIERYGGPLQPFNGRKALVDAAQEALDLMVYLRQEMLERERLEQEIAALRAQVVTLAERVAVQSEVLSRRAEKLVTPE